MVKTDQLSWKGYRTGSRNYPMRMPGPDDFSGELSQVIFMNQA